MADFLGSASKAPMHCAMQAQSNAAPRFDVPAPRSYGPSATNFLRIFILNAQRGNDHRFDYEIQGAGDKVPARQ